MYPFYRDYSTVWVLFLVNSYRKKNIAFKLKNSATAFYSQPWYLNVALLLKLACSYLAENGQVLDSKSRETVPHKKKKENWFNWRTKPKTKVQ